MSTSNKFSLTKQVGDAAQDGQGKLSKFDFQWKVEQTEEEATGGTLMNHKANCYVNSDFQSTTDESQNNRLDQDECEDGSTISAQITKELERVKKLLDACNEEKEELLHDLHEILEQNSHLAINLRELKANHEALFKEKKALEEELEQVQFCLEEAELNLNELTFMWSHAKADNQSEITPCEAFHLTEQNSDRLYNDCREQDLQLIISGLRSEIAHKDRLEHEERRRTQDQFQKYRDEIDSLREMVNGSYTNPLQVSDTTNSKQARRNYDSNTSSQKYTRGRYNNPRTSDSESAVSENGQRGLISRSNSLPRKTNVLLSLNFRQAQGAKPIQHRSKSMSHCVQSTSIIENIPVPHLTTESNKSVKNRATLFLKQIGMGTRVKDDNIASLGQDAYDVWEDPFRYPIDDLASLYVEFPHERHNKTIARTSNNSVKNQTQACIMASLLAASSDNQSVSTSQL